MKNPRFAVARLALVALLVTSGLLLSVTGAAANPRVPGGDVPFYARISRTEIYHTADWAAIVFYRGPAGCIPADFNLLDFFDAPRAFVVCPEPTTGGFEIRIDASADLPPKLTELHGLGAVPVWFVSWPALQAGMADDMLTIGELEGMDPLIGTASFYQETLRPYPTVKASTLELNAKGKLADARSFELHAQAAAHPGVFNECDIHCLTVIQFK